MRYEGWAVEDWEIDVDEKVQEDVRPEGGREERGEDELA